MKKFYLILILLISNISILKANNEKPKETSTYENTIFMIGLDDAINNMKKDRAKKGITTDTKTFGSSKTNCNKAEFALDPLAFVMAIIDKTEKEALNFLNATNMTPAEMLNMFLNILFSTICTAVNPMATIEFGRKISSCISGIELPSTTINGEGGINFGFIFPTPGAEGGARVEVNLSSIKKAGTCIKEEFDKKKECMSGENDKSVNTKVGKECAVVQCYYSLKEEFNKLLNIKIKGAMKVKSRFDQTKKKRCEYKKKAKNKIKDFLKMNEQDKNSYLNVYGSKLAKYGITIKQKNFKPADDLTEKEKKELEKLRKKTSEELKDEKTLAKTPMTKEEINQQINLLGASWNELTKEEQKKYIEGWKKTKTIKLVSVKELKKIKEEALKKLKEKKQKECENINKDKKIETGKIFLSPINNNSYNYEEEVILDNLKFKFLKELEKLKISLKKKEAIQAEDREYIINATIYTISRWVLGYREKEIFPFASSLIPFFNYTIITKKIKDEKIILPNNDETKNTYLLIPLLNGLPANKKMDITNKFCQIIKEELEITNGKKELVDTSINKFFLNWFKNYITKYNANYNTEKENKINSPYLNNIFLKTGNEINILEDKELTDISIEIIENLKEGVCKQVTKFKEQAMRIKKAEKLKEKQTAILRKNLEHNKLLELNKKYIKNNQKNKVTNIDETIGITDKHKNYIEIIKKLTEEYDKMKSIEQKIEEYN